MEALCSRSIASKNLPAALGPSLQTTDWREVVAHPEVDIVAELVGGTTVAREIIDAAIAHKKSVVTANKELMALCGAEIWDRAIAAGINLAMEASVAGGIPIHAVLREGISGDRVTALYGILNGTSNYILTEMEKRGASLDDGAGRSAAAGLCRGRSQRRHRRLRRALEAGASWRRWRSARRSRLPIFSSKASAASRRSISSTRTSWTTPSG